MSLDEIKQALENYDAAMEKVVKDYKHPNRDVREYSWQAFSEVGNKMRDIAPDAIRKLLPVAEAAKAVFTSNGWIGYSESEEYGCKQCVVCEGYEFETNPHADDCPIGLLEKMLKEL